MQALILATTAASIYVAAAALQWLKLSQQRSLTTATLIGLGLGAAALHAASLLSHGGLDSALQPNLTRALSLIFWLLNLVLVIGLNWRPLHNLSVILFPVVAASAVAGALWPGTAGAASHPSGGLLMHIGSSIAAYAVLGLAAFQAAAVALQDHQLRHRRTRGVVRLLPPLQLMEAMLFELIWLGLLLLSASIVSGAVFIDDLFAQGVAHKTVFTMIAWLLFATLLWGHYQLGWRAQTAVRFTLTGCLALSLGYIGSKVVLEVVLGRL